MLRRLDRRHRRAQPHARRHPRSPRLRPPARVGADHCPGLPRLRPATSRPTVSRCAPSDFVSLAAPGTKSSSSPRSRPPGRPFTCPVSAFRTSRWADGRELMDAIGFAGLTPGTATGGVALPSGTVLARRRSPDDDGPVDEFLTAAGLDGWPPHGPAYQPAVGRGPRRLALRRCPRRVPGAAPPPRSASRSRGSSSSCGGRPVPPSTSSCATAAARACCSPPAPRSSRVLGAKVLGVPRTSPVVRLTCQDSPPDAPAGPIRGLLAVPLRPSFAEEA